MAKPLYVDRDGERISQVRWKELRANLAYTTLREYDNAVVQLKLMWNGQVSGHLAQSFPETWPVFILLVKNYRNGELVNDPVDGDKYYPDEATAIAAYEKFLLSWTECGIDNEGGFVEEGNIYEPPPPPDPSKPQTEPDDPSMFEGGAW